MISLFTKVKLEFFMLFRIPNKIIRDLNKKDIFEANNTFVDTCAKDIKELDEKLNEIGSEEFNKVLLALIIDRGYENTYVYKRANISKQEFHKIVTGKNNGKKYIPSKEIIFRICIVLRLTYDEMDNLFRVARYALDDNNKTDLIMISILGIIHDKPKISISDIYEYVDELLKKHKQKPLFKPIENC
ncbi:MAG: hypothetical protein WCQ54_13820 [Clostridiaceae bacterium]